MRWRPGACCGELSLIWPRAGPNRGPRTGSHTVLYDAARRPRPESLPNSVPIRDGAAYTSRALAGRVTETVAKGAADAATASKAFR